MSVERRVQRAKAKSRERSKLTHTAEVVHLDHAKGSAIMAMGRERLLREVMGIDPALFELGSTWASPDEGRTWERVS